MISFADLHCDTLFECYRRKTDLTDPSLHIRTDLFTEFEHFVQVFAHYIPENQPNKWEFLMEFLENSHQLICKHNINYFHKEQKPYGNVMALFSVEGGDLFSCKDHVRERVEYLTKKNVRFFSLIYNHTNALGCGARSDTDTGLTDLGAHVVESLEEYGIIPDISHASYHSAEDILNVTKGPVCATHSNAYSLMPNPRNITDQQLRKIAQKDGLVGVNLYPPFLSKKRAGISDIMKHITHLVDVCGEDHVAFGCDFDGVDQLPEGIFNLSSIHDLYNRMKLCGFRESALEKLFYKNILDFIKTYCGR